jgi:hypothetical protein
VKLFSDAVEIPPGLRRAYLLVLAPVAALAPLPLFWTDGVLPAALAAYELALAILWWRARAGAPVRLSDGVLNVIGLSYFVWLGLELSTFHHGLLRSVSHLLLFTAIAKLASLKRPGESRTALLVLFLLTLAAASSTTHATAILYFIAMAFLAFAALGRLAVLADFDQAPPDRVLRAIPTGGVATGVIVAAGLLAAPLFYALPRLRSPYVSAPARLEDALSSALAADRVELTSFGAAKRSDRVVLRMRVNPERALPRALRLREAVFTEYHDGVWTRQPYARGAGMPRASRREAIVREARPGDDIGGDVSIDLNPFANGFLFLPYEAVGVELDRGYPVALADVIIRLPTNRRAVRYSARMLAREPRGVGGSVIDPRYVPPAIRDYAMKLTGDLSDPGEIYERIRKHFESEFVYTLDPPEAPAGDPVVHFLKNSKAGHCEFFASAAALMLTARGVPARLVTGSYGGEVGFLSSAVVVRGTNLHAWVEAEIDGTGFSVLDPTPAAGIPPATASASWFSRLANLGREIEFFYDRRILGFDSFDQATFLENARQSLGSAAESASELGRLWKENRRDVVKVAFAVLGLLLLAGFLRVRYRSRSRQTIPTRAYVTLRRLLSRRTGALSPAVPPAEVARLFQETFPEGADDARAVVTIYCESAFGGRSPDAVTESEVKERVRRLKKLA